MTNLKQLFFNWRVIILIICLLLGAFSIYPNPWNDGVVIKSIAKNSSAMLAGMEQPNEKIAPMGKERILAINNRPVHNVEDYYSLISVLEPEQQVSIRTNKNTYTLVTKPLIRETVLNETITRIVNITEEVNITINDTIVPTNVTRQETIREPKVTRETTGIEPLGFNVDNAPTSNLRKGLDLQGGTRVVLKPTEQASPETISLVVDSLKERLNVYGLGDLTVREVTDRPGFLGEGQNYILVEIAGVTEEEVRDLLGKQGKFEAKIGNGTVFSGGNDITYVCRTAQCSGIDPNRGCGRTSEGWSCAFQFSITLSPAAAQRQADLTRDLAVTPQGLSEPLVLFLDNTEVDRLNIAADLRGRATTDIAITGGGQGVSEQAAMEDTLANMKRLQTVLITGSLPVKLAIERIDNISPTLGSTFLKNAFTVGLFSILAVVVILIWHYRKIMLAIPIMLTCLSEIFLTIAVAALIGQNLDLAGIAGIILAVGTGVNDQIIITDEALKNRGEETTTNWKERIKKAFFIIFSSYMTMMVAMMPLLFAGAGLLKGFAITTMLAISIGTFITRPAFGAILNFILEK